MSETTEQESQNRGEPRRRVLLTGRLVHGPSELTLDCAIADLSRSGARIRLQGPEFLHEPIFLIDVRHGIAFVASEAWRRGTTVGLTFKRYFDLKDPPPELPAIVRRMWVERLNRAGEA